METLTTTKPKARKEHQCNFCYGTINKGEVYDSQTNVYEGDIYTWKSHTRCSKIASELKMYDDADEGVTGDHFIESIRYAYQDIMMEDNLEHYESKDFKYPPFLEQLEFVCNKKLNE